MCGRVMCRLDPKTVQKLLGSTTFNHQGKYRQSFNAGPMRFLPVAYNQRTHKNQKETAKDNKEKDKSIQRTRSQTDLGKKEETKKQFKKESKKGRKSKSQKGDSEEEEKMPQDRVSNKEEEKGNTNQCEIVIDAMQWGLYRPGSTDLVINGRFEELQSKPMFRGLLENKRCVLIVDGYYEWLENERETRPFFLKNKDEHGYLYLACLYNNAFTKTLGEEYNHFVVLTMDAAKYVRHIHDRMPVLLSEKTKDMWLNPDIPFQVCLKEILTERKNFYKDIAFYEVGDLVNSVKYDKPECILPRKEYEEQLHQKGLGKFFTRVSDQINPTETLTTQPQSSQFIDKKESTKATPQIIEQIGKKRVTTDVITSDYESNDKNKENQKKTHPLNDKRKSKKKDVVQDPKQKKLNFFTNKSPKDPKDVNQ